jgi:cell wall-associated NlpC family hydrolase
LAEFTKATRSRAKTAASIGAGVMGVVTASVGIITPAAYAADYPSWNDVQQAKANVQQQQTMIGNITTLINGLQDSVAAASKASMKADEAYLEAKMQLQQATEKATNLQQQADAADKKSKTSQMRAGLLASHLARAGGQDISVDLMLKGGDGGDAANKLLYQLGTMSKLTEQSQAIYKQATTDKNNAQSLTDQAKSAEKERVKRSDAATEALNAAHAAEAASRAALQTQQQKSTELISQLATLKNTSVAVESSYLKGEAERKAAEAAARAAAEQKARDEAAARAAAAAAAAAANNGGGSNSGSSGGGSTAPASNPNPVPNSNTVERAISYAMAQLGEPYEMGGAGPYTWDCSGLTMMAYRYAGINIGGHGVTYQYYTMQDRGLLFSYSQRKRGDLLFWYDGGFYHEAIYLGGGMMIAAPKSGDVVKVQPVWGQGGDLWYQVGRPAG